MNFQKYKPDKYTLLSGLLYFIKHKSLNANTMIQYEDYNSDARLLVNCLTTEYQWLPLLKERNKPYEILLDYLYELGVKRSLQTENYDSKESQSNRIAEITGVKISKIKGWLI